MRAPQLPGLESGEQARLAQPVAAGDTGVQSSTHRLPGTVLSGCPALPPASPTYLFSATCQPAGALGTSFLLCFWPNPGLPAPSRLGHWAQRLPLRQEAPGSALKGLAFRETWLVIRVGLWTSLVAPLQVAQGCYVEAVPGLGEGGPLSSRLQERAEQRLAPPAVDTLSLPGLLRGSWRAGTRWPPGTFTCLPGSCRLGLRQVGGVCGESRWAELGWRLSQAPNWGAGAWGVTA